MIEVEEVHQEIINAGNIILKILGSDQVIDNAEYFFTDKFYFLFLKEAFPNVEFEINENAVTREEMANNIDAILEFLSRRLLEIDLSHIQGIEIVDQNIDHVTKLLQLLYELSMLINEKQNNSMTASAKEQNQENDQFNEINTADEIQVSLRELIRNSKPPFSKGPWRYKLKKHYRPYDSDIEEANSTMNEYVLNDPDILNRAESTTHVRISDLIPDTSKNSQMQDESSKRTQELKSWSESMPKEEMKGEGAIDEIDAVPKKSVSKISEVSKSKESSTFEDKGNDDKPSRSKDKKKPKKKKPESKKSKMEHPKEDPAPKPMPKHFVFNGPEPNEEQDMPQQNVDNIEDSESEGIILNHSSPGRLQNIEQDSVHNDMNPDEEIEILKQQLKDTMNDEEGMKYKQNQNNNQENELDEDKLFAIQNRPSNVPGKAIAADVSNSVSNKGQQDQDEEEPSIHVKSHTSKEQAVESVDDSKNKELDHKAKNEGKVKYGKPIENKKPKKEPAVKKAPKGKTPSKQKDSKQRSAQSSKKSSKQETPKQQVNNYVNEEEPAEEEYVDNGVNKENEVLQKLNEEMEDNKEINDKIIRQHEQLKQYLREAQQTGSSTKLNKQKSDALLQKNMHKDLKSMKIKERKLKDNFERQKEARFKKREARQMQICQKISKLCVQLERDKLREEQRKNAEKRKERIAKKSTILELIEKFYSNQINELKEQINQEKYERKLIESTHRKALQNLMKDIKDSKEKELANCTNLLDQEDQRFEVLNDDEKIEEEFIKMYKNI